MKPFIIITIISIIFSTASFGQLTKGNWLVGGTASFFSSDNLASSPSNTVTSNSINIAVSPNIGYFITDKFAAGLGLSYTKYKAQLDGSGGLNTNTNRFRVGPFARYYFLNADNKFNILADASYQYGLYWFTPTKGSSNTLSLNAGTVVYFNSSVGLEFLLGYYNTKETIQQGGDNISQQKGFQVNIGFQIHLEK